MLLFLGVTYNLITVKAFPEGSRLTALILGNVIYLVLLFKIDFNLENLRNIFLFAGLFFTMSFLLLKKETEEPKN